MANANTNARVLPAGNTYTTLFTATKPFVGNVVAANTSANTLKIRIAMRPEGITLDDSHFLIYDYILPAGLNYIIHGLTINSQDVVTVFSNETGVAFNLFGLERA